MLFLLCFTFLAYPCRSLPPSTPTVAPALPHGADSYCVGVLIVNINLTIHLIMKTILTLILTGFALAIVPTTALGAKEEPAKAKSFAQMSATEKAIARYQREVDKRNSKKKDDEEKEVAHIPSSANFYPEKVAILAKQKYASKEFTKEQFAGLLHGYYSSCSDKDLEIYNKMLKREKTTKWNYWMNECPDKVTLTLSNKDIKDLLPIIVEQINDQAELYGLPRKKSLLKNDFALYFLIGLTEGAAEHKIAKFARENKEQISFGHIATNSHALYVFRHFGRTINNTQAFMASQPPRTPYLDLALQLEKEQRMLLTYGLVTAYSHSSAIVSLLKNSTLRSYLLERNPNFFKEQ